MYVFSGMQAFGLAEGWNFGGLGGVYVCESCACDMAEKPKLADCSLLTIIRIQID